MVAHEREGIDGNKIATTGMGPNSAESFSVRWILTSRIYMRGPLDCASKGGHLSVTCATSPPHFPIT